MSLKTGLLVLSQVLLLSVAQASTLVGEWNFDGNLNDSVGTNNGVNGGTATYSTDAIVGSECLSLDSQATSYVALNSVSASTLDFSISAWINLDSISPDGFQPIFATNSWGPGGIHFNVQMGGQLVSSMAEGGTVSSAAGAITAGQWYFVEVTYTESIDSLFTLYIDGEQVAQMASSVPGTPITLGNGRIGRWDGDAGRIFNGRIDDLKFSVIPEPATLSLIGIGAMCSLLRRRKRRMA